MKNSRFLKREGNSSCTQHSALGLILIALVAFFAPKVRAQIGSSTAFSPSVTSFIASDGKMYEVTAYAYEASAHHLVGIQSRSSTDNGASWSSWSTSTETSSTAFTNLPAINGTTVDNMDDPQILSIGGDKLVLVVRAWKSNSNDIGGSYAGLPNTIFTNAGIFLAISTDKGQTWGYYSGSNPDQTTTTEGDWATIATSSGSLTTVENPRIAYRKGFSNTGYIVWDNKAWTNAGTVTFTDRYGSPPQTTTINVPDGTGGVWVQQCSVGLAAFCASTNGDNSLASTIAGDGWVFASQTSFANPATPASSDPDTHFCPGPESPSVAISPEGDIWIAYQQVTYAGFDQDKEGHFEAANATSQTLPDAIDGVNEPEAFVYVLEGTFDASSGNYSFPRNSSGTILAQEIVHDEVLGYYNDKRGYLYGVSSTPTYSAIDAMWATGPSIQVAYGNPEGCSYTVGLAATLGFGIRNGPGEPSSWLSFLYADLSPGSTARDFFNGLTGTSADHFSSDLAPMNSDGTPQWGQTWNSQTESFDEIENNGFGVKVEGYEPTNDAPDDFSMRLFPVLKYTSAPDGFASFYPDRSSVIIPSFFSLSYIAVEMLNSASYGPEEFDTVQCRTAVAFDNHQFTWQNAESSSVVLDPNPVSWGTKIDVCGEAGNFTVLPVWHSISGSALATNVGNCILARAYVSNYDPSLDPTDAFPTGHVSTDDVNFSGPIGLFQFGSNTLSLYHDNPSGMSFVQWLPTPASPAANGIYNVVYSKSPSNSDIGTLEYASSPRRIVQTGHLAHAVVQVHSGSDYNIYYTTQRLMGATHTDWAAAEQIDPSTNTWDQDQDIASYSRGNGSDQFAVAVAWFNENSGALQVVVKEMGSGICPQWSQVFSISNAICGCSHIIVPLTAPVNPSSPSTERYLLGWILTWEDPNTAIIHSATLLRGGESSNQLLQNDDWGDPLYPNYSFTPVDNVLTGISPADGTNEGVLSVTSDENNSTLMDQSNEIIFTAGGEESGVKAFRAYYNTSGSSLGEWNSNEVGANVPHQLDAVGIDGEFDEEPSITVTSAGQNIAAWDHIGPGPSIPDWPLPGMTSTGFLSSIRIANTADAGGGVWSVLQDFITQPYAGDANFHWLANPSVTAFPKTTLTGSADPHAAELLYTQWDGYCYCSPVPGSGISPFPHKNQLNERLFWDQTYGTAWSGNWTKKENSPFPTSGGFSQRSFGQYTIGPHLSTTYPHPILDESNQSYTHGLSYALGNAVSGNTITNKFATPVVGALKGTFPQPIGEDLYRVEDRFMSKSSVEFQWGGVYVDDTALGMPAREVILNDLSSDSGAISHTAIRDSIFQTEWFDWPVSGEVVYNRWMAIATGRFKDSTVDSTTVDSLRGQQPTPCNGESSGTGRITVHTPDSTVRGDSTFIQPCIYMNYTVELVHQSGRIDTVDRMTYNPYAGQLIAPHTVHLVNASDFADTVMLRVRGDFSPCVPDSDSNVVFGREQMLDSIRDLGDTTLAIGSGGIVPPPDTCFAAMGPYANPSDPSANDVSVVVHYCGIGQTISAQVYTQLGNPVGAASTFTSDGQIWDRIPINAPSTSGTYYIQVTVGSYVATLGYAVN